MGTVVWFLGSHSPGFAEVSHSDHLRLGGLAELCLWWDGVGWLDARSPGAGSVQALRTTCLENTVSCTTSPGL